MLVFHPLILTQFYIWLTGAGRLANIQNIQLSAHACPFSTSEAAQRPSECDSVFKNGVLWHTTPGFLFLVLSLW